MMSFVTPLERLTRCSRRGRTATTNLDRPGAVALDVNLLGDVVEVTLEPVRRVAGRSRA